MKKMLLCLVATLFISPVFADVYKWKDADGKTHYGDAPSMTGTAKVKTDKQTDDQISNGERIRAETTNNNSQGAARDPKCEELLSDLKNHEFGDIGSKTFTELASIKAKRNAITQEYELRCMSSSDRQANQEKRSNAQTQNQLRQIQRTQQEIQRTQEETQRTQEETKRTTEETKRTTEDMRRTQKYGY